MSLRPLCLDEPPLEMLCNGTAFYTGSDTSLLFTPLAVMVLCFTKVKLFWSKKKRMNGGDHTIIGQVWGNLLKQNEQRYI